MISREAFDNLIIKKRKHRNFTDSVPLEFKRNDVIEAEKAPWDGVMLISDTGRLDTLSELEQHRDELDGYFTKLLGEKDSFMNAFRNGQLSAGQGKYVLEYENKLNEILQNHHQRNSQVWISKMYTKGALLDVYTLSRAIHPERKNLLFRSHYRGAETSKEMLAQILTEDMQLDVDKVVGTHARILRPRALNTTCKRELEHTDNMDVATESEAKRQTC